ncbi:Retrovirus-related Pol polyprotein from transposon [Trichinella nelsoni]|uniref:Retrovirus-related Pol polyprotein from transposon n=1 Tax=Trichinella nelsoni TaxID=6336 RepID=A0A0V0RI03_9BILA|nr:Retrovirus-related Pol polyprotein from transposon [Trichinella nelsoni]
MSRPFSPVEKSAHIRILPFGFFTVTMGAAQADLSIGVSTRVDAQPISCIDDTLHALAEARYWQVEVAERDREKTAFSTPLGFFQFCVMPFRLCNAPETFQRLMETALRGLTWKTCLVYLDDNIVFRMTEEEHVGRLERVLSRLQSVGLKIKPEKGQLMLQSVHYLSHIVM